MAVLGCTLILKGRTIVIWVISCLNPSVMFQGWDK